MTKPEGGVVHVPYLLMNERTCMREQPKCDPELDLADAGINLVRPNDRRVFVHVPTERLYVEDGVDIASVEIAIARADAELKRNFQKITTIIPPS